MNNIFWVKRLGKIGGVETFIYELAKMFSDYDLVIYYEEIDQEQLKRLKQYVRCIKYHGEKLKCKKFFMNYDISIIDNVDAEEYIEMVHCVFKHNKLKPHTHPKITKYFAVGKEAAESFEEITGLKCEVVHNPITIEEPKRFLKLISATRLDADKGKILERTVKLANELEKNNIPYIWHIFTTSTDTIKNPNITYMKPSLDIRDYIVDYDYLVQLSDTEAFCYSVLEALNLNVPCIVTDIPCFKEMKLKNKINGYVLDFDMQNIPVNEIYNEIPKFSYQPLKDEWFDKIEKIKSNYKEERKMKVKVKCIKNYHDTQKGKLVTPNDEPFVVELARAEELVEAGVCEIVEKPVEIVKDLKEKAEEVTEKVKEEVKKVEAKVKKATKKK